MSPTIPILSALLLSLISGSTEDGQRMDSVALLRQTLRYWRKIYKTYHEEVMLGYCWADYLLEISDELSANLSATAFAATGDRSNTSIGATKSQQKPFLQNVMVHATPHVGTRTGKHLRGKRSHATASSIIWKFIKGADEHRDASRSRIIGKRQRWTMNIAERGVALKDRADESDESDGNESTAPLIDSYDEKRRHAPTTSEVHYDKGKASRDHEFSSRWTNSRPINPSMSNSPKDHDKVDSRSTDFDGEEEKEEKDTPRKVLRSLTSHCDSPEAILQPRSFSLKVSRGRRRRSTLDDGRFPFRRWPPPRERNPRIDEPLSDLCRIPEVDRGMRRNPGGRRVPLSGDGGIPTSSRLQFRRVNADTDHRRRRRTVKLMDSKGNSSRDSAGAINSETSRRQSEELSRDSLLSPRGGGAAGAERSTLESRRGGRVAIKRIAFSRAETSGASTRKRRFRRSGEEEGLRSGRDVSLVPIVMCIFGRSGLKRTEQELLYGERWESFPVAAIPEESAQRDEQLVRTMRSASLLPLEEFTNDYGDSTSRLLRNSRSNVSWKTQARDRQSLVQQTSFAFTVRSIIIAVFRTLGMFVQVGRQIMDVVESNAALACTKEYLWVKIIKWIDT